MDTQPIANCCPKCQAPLPPDAPQGLCPKCLFAAVATPTEAGQPAGHRTAPPPVEEIAAAFPQLEILEFIGQGGMGFVFKARQPKLDRLVALKILPRSLAADPTFAERFNREAKLLARLNHPGIVAVHDFGVATGRADLPVRQGNEAAQQHRPTNQFYYLLMEFVDGVNLRQAMQAGRFTPDQALAIVPKICEALQFAHNEGILHRDIKPENILLDGKGRVKIADFGIAKLVGNDGRADLLVSQAAQQHRPTEANLTEAGKTLGSPNYMAPEQLEHPGEVDHRADIYSLGVVFYEMLTGELPLGRFAPPSQKSAADPRVDEVVLRALEKERERRQHSAGEVRTQVETIVSDPKKQKTEVRSQKSEGVPRHFFPPETPLPNTSFDDSFGNVNWWWLVVGIPGIFLILYSLKGGRLIDYLGSDSFGLSLALMGAFALLTLLSHVRKKRGRVVLVGVSGGKREINWTGVIQIWVLIYAAFMAGSYFAFGRWVPFHDLIAGMVGAATLVTAALVQVELKKPLEQLPTGNNRRLPCQSAAPAGGEAHSEKSGIGNRKLEIAPRFSRTAIVGACWFPFCLVVLLFYFWSPQAVSVSPGNSVPPVSGPNWLGLVLGLPMALLGLTAPFGMTILGWVAVSQIRRSAGKLYGLWLAVSDGLLFPLLALDALIILWLNHTSGFSLPYSPSVNFTLICALILAGDIFIIRRVWRAVNRPLENATGNAGVPHAKLDVAPGSASNKFINAPPEGARQTHWEKWALGLCVAGFVLPVLMLLWNFPPGGLPPETPLLALVWVGICEIAALVLGIIGWRSGLDKPPLNAPPMAPNSNHERWGIWALGLCVAGLVLPALMLWMDLAPETALLALVWVGLCEVPALVLGTIGWRSGTGKVAVIAAVLLSILYIPLLERPEGSHRNNYYGQGKTMPEAEWQNISSGPMIERVVVSKDHATITGRSPDAGMFIIIGALTNNDVWVAPHDDWPWTVTLTPQSFWRGGFDWVVKASYGNITYRLDSKAGSMTGRIVFRPGTPAPEANGSYVIGEFQQASGPPLPIAVRLERTSKQPASPAPNLSFGPVIERILNETSTNQDCALDLDTGNLLTPPQNVLKQFTIEKWNEHYGNRDHADWKEIQDWARSSGADLICSPSEIGQLKKEGPTLLNSYKTAEGADYWTMSAINLVRLINKKVEFDSQPGGSVGKFRLGRFEPLTTTTLNMFDAQLPQTFGFETREGSQGVLQITGLTENPRGVKIRYKLVQNANAKTMSTQPTPPTSAFQIHLVAEDSEANVSTDTLTNYIDGTHVEQLRLVKEVLMDGAAVEQAGWHVADGQTNFVIGLTEAGSRQFETLTAASLKRRIAVIFQGRILAAPVINSRISTRSLDFAVRWDRKDLERTMNGLNQMKNPAVNLRFGPVQENVLPTIETSWIFLNLRANRLIPTSPPDFESRAFHDWQRKNGADLVATVSDVAATGEKLPSLIGYGMATAQAFAKGLDNNSPADIWYNWNLMVNEPEARSHLTKLPNSGQDTFYFRTSDDTWGVLQITGFTGTPRGVKFRYKLVQNSPSTNSQ